MPLGRCRFSSPFLEKDVIAVRSSYVRVVSRDALTSVRPTLPFLHSGTQAWRYQQTLCKATIASSPRAPLLASSNCCLPHKSHWTVWEFVKDCKMLVIVVGCCFTHRAIIIMYLFILMLSRSLLSTHLWRL
ncbi:hypothetical protein TRVL_04955 [Trypanosoma vivax]|uniref:Uncharacterized protein n=1 Tax=Trypanosoma vivax (strain Y486) TaxID=1055687 RepID=G0U3N5_TRYVY|nr:hypothetical protein TRVL_04955 [Trypanosoma vivax]CCC50892.1 hypothetical protein TVY486_0907130 [Trypanosoma vivax Y486]